MSLKYTSLQDLLQAESHAMEYFDSLPMQTRENISTRSSHVNSFKDLIAMAQNLNVNLE